MKRKQRTHTHTRPRQLIDHGKTNASSGVWGPNRLISNAQDIIRTQEDRLDAAVGGDFGHELGRI